MGGASRPFARADAGSTLITTTALARGLGFVGTMELHFPQK